MMSAEITLIEVFAVVSGILGLFGLSFIVLFIPKKSCAGGEQEEQPIPETIIVDKHGYFSRHDDDHTA